MKNKIKQHGKLSKEELQKLIKEHGTVYTLDIYFEDENKEIVQLFAYLRKAQRHEASMALAIRDRNPLGAKEILLAKTWLAGDYRIKTNDDAFYTACTVIDEMFIVRNADLSSRQAEFHRKPLTEPYVTVSRHTALLIQI